MNKIDVFKTVQSYLSEIPLILVGTGASIPVGISGMYPLAIYLKEQLDDKYKSNAVWERFCDNLSEGYDLERASTEVILESNIEADVKKCTWELISKDDLKLFEEILSEEKSLPIVNLLKYFYQYHPQCINVITTNYDRMIEYACDIAELPIDIRYTGTYIKRTSFEKPKTQNIINLYKVHGSLDTFINASGSVVSIPLQSTIPKKMIPSIITPGSNKYRDILNGPSHDVLQEADIAFKQAKSYLCIGYGFNDSQIQRSLLQEAAKGKKLVVVTKQLSDKSFNLLNVNCKNYIVIQVGSDQNSTEFWLGRNCFEIPGKYWSVDGLLEILQ